MPLYRLIAFLLIAATVWTAGCETPTGNNPETETETEAESEPEPEQEPDPTLRLVSQMVLAPKGLLHSDVWGYVDAATGKEYALVGTYGATGLYIVDVSDPATPVHVATVDVPSFDMKVWGHYAYTVTGSPDRPGDPLGRIIDLSTPEAPVVVGAFPSSHNLFIDDQGYMYLESPGVRILDLNADPTDPVLIWTDNASSGHDASVIGDRLYDFHGSRGTYIYDVTSRAAPRLLGTIELPAIAYHHSGWSAHDDAYLFICDELSQDSTADITVWDIQDPSNPTHIADIGDPDATVHNLYIIDDLAYTSYYTAGFRVYDVSDPAAPRLVAEYDTALGQAGPGFRGTWGVYPFTPSGHVYVSDMNNGLYVFELVR